MPFLVDGEKIKKFVKLNEALLPGGPFLGEGGDGILFVETDMEVEVCRSI